MKGKLFRFDKMSDIGFKIFSIVAICFGALRYFQEKDDISRAQTLTRSLSYIEDYGSSRYAAARIGLYDFWIEHSELVDMLSSTGISDRAYRAALEQGIFKTNRDEAIREELVLLANFYSQINFCYRTGLCDVDILQEFFCPVARSEAIAYGPFFENISKLTGDRDIGRDLISFENSCPDFSETGNISFFIQPVNVSI